MKAFTGPAVPWQPPGAEGSIFVAGRPTLLFLCCSFQALQQSFDTPGPWAWSILNLGARPW